MKLCGDHNSFTNEHYCLAYMIGLLTNHAFTQVQHWLTSDVIDLVGRGCAPGELKQAFGDLNQEQRAEHDLRVLLQNNSPLVEYGADFQRLPRDT